MGKSNLYDYTEISKQIHEISKKLIELTLEKEKLNKQRKLILKKCIESKEITIDTLFRLI